MTPDREKSLQRLIELRFSDISPRDARAAYEAGFPFGIAGVGAAPQERVFVERYAGVVFRRLLMRIGESRSAANGMSALHS